MFHNTPGSHGGWPSATKALSAQEELFKLEDAYSEWRKDACNGLFEPKPEDELSFKEKIAAARTLLASQKGIKV